MLDTIFRSLVYPKPIFVQVYISLPEHWCVVDIHLFMAVTIPYYRATWLCCSL